MRIRPAVFHGRNKYRAKPTVIDGIRFASKLEAARYADLLLRQRLGEISGLELQVRYALHVNGVKICDYIADFRYREGARTVVEDAKGVRTRDYAMKARLMLAVHGITIHEHTARTRGNGRRRPR